MPHVFPPSWTGKYQSSALLNRVYTAAVGDPLATYTPRRNTLADVHLSTQAQTAQIILPLRLQSVRVQSIRTYIGDRLINSIQNCQPIIRMGWAGIGENWGRRYKTLESSTTQTCLFPPPRLWRPWRRQSSERPHLGAVFSSSPRQGD